MTTGLGTSATGRDPAARKAAYLGVGVTIALTGVVFAPILYHMVLHWKAVDDYSHGFLIAPLAIYFAWERRRKVDAHDSRPRGGAWCRWRSAHCH